MKQRHLPFILGIALLQLLLLVNTVVFSQSKNDTMVVTADNVNTKVLQPSINRYLVYFKMGKDSSRSRVWFWTRNIEYGTHQGKEAIIITQEWEDKDTVIHKVKTFCDKKTFTTLYHNSWWKQGGTSEFDFIDKTFFRNGIPLSDNDTARGRKYAWLAFKSATTQYWLNWHLDLEVFPLLDYKNGRTFAVPFHDPGSAPPTVVYYTVTGSGELTGYNGQKIEC